MKAYRVRHPDPEVAPLPVEAARIAKLETENRRLAEENAFLKSRGLLREGAAVSEKFTLIHAEKANHTVGLMTRLLEVSRAGYYAWASRRGTLSDQAARHVRLTALVVQIHDDSHQVNGLRRVLAELSRRGIAASEGLVRSIMWDAGIFGVQPRGSERTTIPAADAADRPDLLRRDFTADRHGTRRVGDITYLRTGEGWLYLATVIDLYNREVVGWSMADHMRTELIGDALKMAHAHAHGHGHVEPGAVSHSDRGSQYTSEEYTQLAKDLNVRLSVGRTGSCWDNAVIEVFYNRQRLHSTLGDRTPVEARAAYDSQTAAAA